MRLWRCVATCAIVVSGLGVTGCAGVEDVEQARARAAALGERLDAQADRWEALAGAMGEDDPRASEVGALASAARAQASIVKTGVEGVDAALSAAKNPSGFAGRILEAVLPFLPAPVRAPVVLGAGALAAGVRAWRLKQGLGSVVRGLTIALREDEAFAERFKAHADTFRATQTSLAKRIVDKVAGRAVTA